MNVLVATDGSRDANDAVEWLAHFPLPSDATMEVVSVIRAPILDESVLQSPWTELRSQTECVVEDTRARLAKRWPAATGRILRGDPRAAIVGAATERTADLIVLGARGLGALASVLLGSVSLGVAHYAPCSVLVCRSAARPIRTVTIGVDGGADARAAWKLLGELPLSDEVVVRIIGVVEPLRYPSTAPRVMTASLKAALRDYEAECCRDLGTVAAAAAEDLRGRVSRVISATPIGVPAQMIVRDAKEHHSDLIVVGARGVGGFKRLVLGSVSESVLRHSSCPVLVARPRG
jgi:nucleotide-binding universal stress UspA family protein